MLTACRVMMKYFCWKITKRSEVKGGSVMIRPDRWPQRTKIGIKFFFTRRASTFTQRKRSLIGPIFRALSTNWIWWISTIGMRWKVFEQIWFDCVEWMTFWHIFTCQFNGRNFHFQRQLCWPPLSERNEWGLSPFCRRVAGESCPDGGINIPFISSFHSFTVRSIGSNNGTTRAAFVCFWIHEDRTNRSAVNF